MRSEWRAQEGNLSVKGRRTTQRPLLRVRATRLRASASRELARKPDILIERKRANANSFNSVRESAVRGKEEREIFDEFDNGRERGGLLVLG